MVVLVDIPRDFLNPPRIAFTAIKVLVQGVAAAALFAGAERRAAVLARVARDVEALIQSYYTYCFLCAALWDDWLAATGATWRVPAYEDWC